MADYNRPRAKCPYCFSEERHRALSVFLDRWLPTVEVPVRLLHQAPEGPIRQRLEHEPGLIYITADIADAAVTIRYDLHQMPFRSESVSAVVASHVLEHVDDDRAVMSELLRILRPGGQAILMVPIDNSRARTHEDPGVTTPEQRSAEYWQFDHVRLYGRDFGDRLTQVGFTVRVEQPSRQLPPKLVRRYGLTVDPSVYERYPIAPPDEIFVGTRDGSGGEVAGH